CLALQAARKLRHFLASQPTELQR
ncbi:hypothetical protein TGARI_304640B, partial [Toxoplasma gondii ARI]